MLVIDGHIDNDCCDLRTDLRVMSIKVSALPSEQQVQELKISQSGRKQRVLWRCERCADTLSLNLTLSDLSNLYKQLISP